MTRRVVISGMGVVSPLGNDVNNFSTNLFSSFSAVRRLEVEVKGRQLAVPAAMVDIDPLAHFSKMALMSLDRFSQLAVLASREALSSWPKDSPAAARCGVYIGCGMGGANQIETTYQDLYIKDANKIRPVTVVNIMGNAAAAHIAMEHGLKGPNQTYSNACSSSAIAIGEAMRAIRHGYIDSALAGGTEALLTFGSLQGWRALGVLADMGDDPSKACRPFSANRTGLALSEGAAMLLLESEEQALARGATIYGEVLGYGSSCDAGHLTKPDPVGQSAAIRAALSDARIEPSAVGYINAHGTATQAGDIAESQAIRTVFGANAPPVSATKSMVGHLLGAAGALEAVATLCALQQQILPATINLDTPDPACDLDYVPNTARKASFDIALSNSFAFGGSNASLVLGRYHS
ncbi:MAG: beta-ketoacyl-[acyl-carrier-protein] synthase family protein [Burkholderiaceae bacterium]